ncbi:hypothetical protein GRI72_02785 [Altererythrobacter marinus]|uniref:Uncharacterized protein n=1 Tax=Pelagerythrobacter marinus TaxID=538382 RepID=A0ABW9UTN2_9SPHN|nr:hypothetical protein [Pelagerythrobacter marinus]MXO67758.1 hypothetical protein [Pelagerythrobacter marinus]
MASNRSHYERLCARQDDISRMSLSDLHYRIGKAVEDRPGVLNAPDGTSNTNVRHFERMEVSTLPTMGRLQDIADQAREEMGEARWQELQAEWPKEEEYL